jgi:hypothetical protein
MRDRKTATIGRLDGVARFTADGEMLRFSESGTLFYGGLSTEAARDYRFEIVAEDRFRVFFADGRLFHEARVVGGIAPVAHDCAPDLYRGRYRLDGPERWRLSWRVTGPRKDLVICSVFSRSHRREAGR